jgi:ketosteroid isomerase-like protein
MISKRLIFAVLALYLIAMPVLAEESRTDEEQLREIKEVQWPKAYAEQDVELLGRILAPEFQMIDSEGNWSTRAGELEWIAKNKPGYDTFHYEIKRLDIFENGTAVVAGTGHISGTGEDGPYQAEYQSSNILIKRDGRWQAISSHVSGVKEK